MTHRRNMLKGTIGVIASAYIWIPKIAIASYRDDFDSTIVKQRQNLVRSFDLSEQDENGSLQSSGIQAKIESAHDLLRLNNYTRDSGPGTKIAISSDRHYAFFGCFNSNNENYAGSYLNKSNDNNVTTTNLSTLPFISHTNVISTIGKSVTTSSLLDNLYPNFDINEFEFRLGDISLPNRFVSISTKLNVIIMKFHSDGSYSGSGTTSIVSRATKQIMYEETFDYEFSK